MPRVPGGCAGCRLSWWLFIALVQFRAARVADWVPREMRHTIVSLLSSNGTTLE